MKCHNIIAFLLFLFLASQHTGSAQTWSSPNQVVDANSGAGGFSGSFSNLLVVEGKPAMADNPGGSYSSGGHLRYLRANDASGTGPWSTVISPDPAAGTGQYLSLQIVNGKPAISYYDQINGNLKFVRATDQFGTEWGEPIIVDAIGDVGQYTSLQSFNNRAVISYYDVTNGDLKFAQAKNPEGTSWDITTIDATNNVGQYTSLQIINGKPSVAYYEVTNGDLKYAVLNGTPPWSISTLDAAGDVGRFASLHEVNNSAAVSYYNYQTSFFGIKGSLQYVVPGSSPIVLDGGTANANIDVGLYTSLQIVNGNPAISYLDNYNRTLKFIRAKNMDGTDWSVPPVIAAAPGGFYSSLQVVDGLPAISYHDQTNFDLKYVRATDATGTDITKPWGSFKTFDVIGDAGSDISLQFVGGFPAIVYSTSARDYSSNRRLLYVRATDASGAHWGTPVTVDSAGGRDVSLQIVDGKPAISYASQSGNIKYAIAKDNIGEGWETPITVDGASGGSRTSLMVVKERPAISYSVYNYPNSPIKYVRANNPSGYGGDLPWPATPVQVDPVGGTHTCLQIINGNPAISFYTFNNDYSNPAGALKYIRSDDEEGNGWTMPVVTVQSGGDVGLYNSLQMVNGRPAISYYDQTNKDLKFVRADDPTGVAWTLPPVPIDVTGDVGRATSLQIVNGKPSISYFDATNNRLKYARANDSSGTGWRTPSTLAPGGSGQYTSMDTTVNVAGIAYQNNGLPYYISGALTATDHYFRTVKSGNWNDGNAWESSPMPDFTSGKISPATLAPDFNANSITVQNAHTVTVSTNVTADQIVVNSGGSISITNGDTLFINDGAGYDITVDGSVTVEPGGNMTLKSTSSGTASVGVSTGNISGNVTVERFIPSRRAWRLITGPFSAAQTINAAWQEGRANIPALGTHITGGTAVNGFDQSPTNSSSIRWYDRAANTLSPLASTFTPITDQPAYFLFVRGDRTVNLSQGAAAPATNTVLRATGTLKTGTQAAVPVAASGFTLAGNPYASPIDFALITKPNVPERFWLWDPKRSSAGSYVLFEAPNYEPVPAGGSYITSNSIIESSTAFFVEGSGTAGSLNINENSKSQIQKGAFRTNDGTDEKLQVNLHFINPDNTTTIADAAISRYNNNYSMDVTAEDAGKPDNIDENLAIVRNNRKLMVERRPVINKADTIFLTMYNMREKNYQFEILPDHFTGDELSAYLEDVWLKTSTPISLSTPTTIQFSVTSIAGSSDANRFRIVFKLGSALPVNFTVVEGYQKDAGINVVWNVTTESNINHYEIEKSADGKTFERVATIRPNSMNNATANYSWIDNNPLSGDNFYRIKAFDNSGQVRNSNIIDVKIINGKSNIVVYPMPITNKTIFIRFNNQPKGTYLIGLYNSTGQQLMKRSVRHEGGSSTTRIPIQFIASKGVYHLSITNGENKVTEQITIE